MNRDSGASFSVSLCPGSSRAGSRGRWCTSRAGPVGNGSLAPVRSGRAYARTGQVSVVGQNAPSRAPAGLDDLVGDVDEGLHEGMEPHDN